MANYQLLKADIDAKVYENAHREITGENLNAVLNAMVTTLGAEYQFAGVATIDTNPEITDAKVFYIANGKGTYTNFGGLEVTEDEVVVLYWDSAWHKVATGIASQAKLSELENLSIYSIHTKNHYDVNVWISGKVYLVNFIVAYNGKFYRCISSHISNTEFDSSKWTEITDIISDGDIVAKITTKNKEYNIQTSTVRITGIGESATIAGATNIGDVFLNTHTNLLRYRYSDNSFKTILYNKNTIYLIGGKQYCYDGFKLQPYSNIVNIAGIGANSTEAGIRSEEIYFNTRENVIIRVYHSDGYIMAVELPFENDTIYVLKGKQYLWKNEKFVPFDTDNITQKLVDLRILDKGVEIKAIETSSLPVYQWLITSDGICTSSGNSLIYNISENDKGNVLSIEGNNHSTARVAFLRSLPNVDYRVDFAHIDSRIEIHSNESKSIIIPENAVYLYIYSNNGENLPSKLTINELIKFADDTNFKSNISLDSGALSVTRYYNGNFPSYLNDHLMAHDIAKRTNCYVSVKDFVKTTLPNSVGAFILMYNSDYEYVECMELLNSSVLPSWCKYIKLMLFKKGNEIDTSWTNGTLDNDQPLSNRIKSGYIDLNSFGSVCSSRTTKIIFRFYDVNKTMIGNSGGIRQMIVGRNDLKSIFNPINGGSFSNVRYIAIMVGFDDDSNITSFDSPALYEYASVKIPSTLEIETGCEICSVKNPNTDNNTLNLSFPTRVFRDSNDRTEYFGKCLLRLPLSYTNEGNPTKLIIFKTGSKGFPSMETNEFNYLDYIKYWIAQGYAVMDYYGATSKYECESFGFPTNLAAASSAYDFVIKSFNIDTNGAYVSAKSLGGYTSHELCFNSNIPIKAAAFLAPAIDNKRYCFGYTKKQREIFANDAHLEGNLSIMLDSWSSDKTKQFTEEFKNIVKNNYGKLCGYMPMVNGIINKKIEQILELDPEVERSFADVVRIVRVPTRYWVAPDDVDTPYQIAENMVISAQNGNSPVSLRTLPSGTGGHHAVDNDPNALKIESIETRYGGVMMGVPLAYVEALDFLERY